ncbi:hypothetical protein HDU67_007671 [Dinochytrium kinnereticum]|nr:hypothetical protein HDU67_007671 [Dinochytrium kinnereticum]
MQASVAAANGAAAAVLKNAPVLEKAKIQQAASSSFQAGPVFEDNTTVMGVFAVMAVSLVVAILASLVLEHLNTLKAEGTFVKRLRMIEHWTGLNLNWVLTLYDIPIPSEKKVTVETTTTTPKSIPANQNSNSPGTTSGHPKPGLSAMGGPIRPGSLPSPINLYPPSRVNEPKPPTTESVLVKATTSTAGPIPPLGSKLSSLTSFLPFASSATAQKVVDTIVPTFPIKPRTLYATRDDPFHPELGDTPVPIAAALDLVDMSWEAAVNTVAWGVGVAFVRPVWAAQKVVKRTANAIDGATKTVVTGSSMLMGGRARSAARKGKAPAVVKK